MRPDWDTTWMTVARTIALRSRCSLRQVGAVIASPDHSYIVVGYNGPPATYPLPGDVDCQSWCPRAQMAEQTHDYRNCVSVHAEMNAIAKADRSRIMGGTLYVSSSVCWDCSKVVANSGVHRVVMCFDPVRDAHRNPVATWEFLGNCGLRLDVMD